MPLTHRWRSRRRHPRCRRIAAAPTGPQ